MVRGEEKGIVRCASCGLTDELPAKPAHKEIDVYSSFTDKYYSKARKPTTTPPTAATATTTQATEAETQPPNPQ
jgi:transcription elongation factor Elf1